MRSLRIIHIFILLALAPVSAPAQPPPDPFKVMITEVSWGEPDGVELANFGTAPQSLQGWRVVWKDAAGTVVSAPLNLTLPPGAFLVVLEQNPAPATEIPALILLSPLLPSLSTTTESIAVALQDAQGTIVDEVLITNTSGGVTTSISGSFRGFARRGMLFPSISVERIWGLDSDAGLDWSEETNRSFGLENRSAGARNGQDPIQVQPVWINEIDTAPDLVELVNRSGATLDIRDWYLLISDAQGSPVRRVNPWPSAFVVGAGRYVVLFEGLLPPPEMPGTALFASLPPSTLVLGSRELSLGLYDRLGRLVDLVRTTEEAGTVVHNHPRVPSWPFDFAGAAPRLLSGDRAFGRASAIIDTNTGADWRAINTRTMGAANIAFVGAAGHADLYDVRINDGESLGLTVILNAGTVSANHAYSYFFSLGHHDGLGPFFGLGPDALLNWLILSSVPPFSGILDARGSARFDFGPGSLPPGFQADCLFIVQAPGGVLTKRTLIVEFDT